MKTAFQIQHAHEVLKNWSGESHDHVTLDYDSRHRRRILLQSDHGQDILLDLPDMPDLREGDALRLRNGLVVAILAKAEALMEIRASDHRHLTRLAWHIGNRHLAAEISAHSLRIRADHVIADMIIGLGGTVERIEAPFHPEGGAYDQSVPVRSHSHWHSHGHNHDQNHDHKHPHQQD